MLPTISRNCFALEAWLKSIQIYLTSHIYFYTSMMDWVQTKIYLNFNGNYIFRVPYTRFNRAHCDIVNFCRKAKISLLSLDGKMGRLGDVMFGQILAAVIVSGTSVRDTSITDDVTIVDIGQ